MVVGLDDFNYKYNLRPLEEELSVDQPVAMLAARISDIRPDGKITRVTYGLLNLTHRESNENPKPLEANKKYRDKLSLNDFAHKFPAGHRISLAISTSYWPLAWPAPKDNTITIYSSASDRGKVYFEDIDWVSETHAKEKYFLKHDKLDSIHAETHWKRSYQRGGWHVKSITHTEMTSDEKAFYVHAWLDAFENGKRIFSKNWEKKIPRSLV